MQSIDPAFEDGHRQPEQRLIGAVIGQAYADMFAAKASDRREAISFFTASYGATRAWRNLLFDMLDIDGDVVADRIRDALTHRKPLATSTTHHGGDVERAYQTWDLLSRSNAHAA